jgi:hypothetical protein
MKKMIILLLACCISSVPAFNSSLGIKSAILPGMGQLSAGFGNITSKNTLKGLGIMAGFTFTLNGLISNISQRESYAEQTQLFSDQFAAIHRSGDFAEADVVYKKWKSANDNYNSANLALFVYLGVTVAIYGYGVVDALLFTQPDTPQGEAQPGPASSLLAPQKIQIQCARNQGRPDIKVSYSF